MCAFDVGAGVLPSAERKSEGVIETESEEIKKKKEAARLYADIRLHELAPRDEMYNAMENFLLGDPKNQIPLLGAVVSVIEKGNIDRDSGNRIVARADYETAAKVAIYNQNKDEVKKSIRLAMDVTDRNTSHLNFQRTILDNLDEVLRIAKDYYSTIPQISS